MQTASTLIESIPNTLRSSKSIDLYIRIITLLSFIINSTSYNNTYRVVYAFSPLVKQSNIIFLRPVSLFIFCECSVVSFDFVNHISNELP